MAIPEKCPRCNGFMISENDQYGWHGDCIRCGYVYEPDAISPEELAEEEARSAGKRRWKL